MTNELQKIFESIDKDVLNEETLGKMSELIKEKINSAVTERVTLEVESALKTQNVEHGTKWKRIMEAIDMDHTNKVRGVVKTLNEKHIKKLLTLKEKYEKVIKEDAVKTRNSLTESVNLWIDRFLNTNLPKEQIAEAAKNKYIEKVLKEARQVLSVDPNVVKENVRSALQDGKTQIDKLVKENHQLKQQSLVSESKKLLAEKTAKLPVDVAKFVNGRLANKDPEFIKNNFKYVVEMFERIEEKEKRSASVNTKPVNFDRQRIADDLIKEETNERQIIQESANSAGAEDANPMIDLYLESMSFRK